MDTQTILETARLLVEEFCERVETPEPHRMDFYLVQASDVLTAAAGLRVKRLGYLAAITGLDPGAESQELEVLYHFCTAAAVVTLRARLPKAAPEIPSLCQIIPGAEPFERELREMFGVEVIGLRNPELLYLPEDWEEGVYPLRKDFVLQKEQQVS
ncbi:MAG: NADH-quinone oxidoreductase subunit C [Anaerolineales bacterium]|nr:NADH-quinone oxidoreductase subunit C [Anaerolineales bacterium]